MTDGKKDNLNFLLYGANGYTGQLITRYAMEAGLTPILAGRNQEAIQSLAAANDLEYRIFDLDDRDEVDRALEGIKLVLHAAGPFIYTAKPMIKACIKNGVHYLDITGEIAIFEMASRFDQKAKAK
ncbi:MAG: saccharopine dehydrogenase NADP-binding domain-containing protein, partial [Flavobacteriaceae bacterium]